MHISLAILKANKGLSLIYFIMLTMERICHGRLNSVANDVGYFVKKRITVYHDYCANMRSICHVECGSDFNVVVTGKCNTYFL